ncbi:hypothetical protein VP01_7g6 [Puccinia sorghi]|uniref:Uncharacterized protein n=1 Tax=Puccinia sorghi TaxID=27349 RepID=A0A0L6UAM5_9BASI|nr:hypothetical protein VP01_7g6 [Puccinia sorghi]
MLRCEKDILFNILVYLITKVGSLIDGPQVSLHLDSGIYTCTCLQTWSTIAFKPSFFTPLKSLDHEPNFHLQKSTYTCSFALLHVNCNPVFIAAAFNRTLIIEYTLLLASSHSYLGLLWENLNIEIGGFYLCVSMKNEMKLFIVLFNAENNLWCQFSLGKAIKLFPIFFFEGNLQFSGRFHFSLIFFTRLLGRHCFWPCFDGADIHTDETDDAFNSVDLTQSFDGILEEFKSSLRLNLDRLILNNSKLSPNFLNFYLIIFFLILYTYIMSFKNISTILLIILACTYMNMLVYNLSYYSFLFFYIFCISGETQSGGSSLIKSIPCGKYSGIGGDNMSVKQLCCKRNVLVAYMWRTCMVTGQPAQHDIIHSQHLVVPTSNSPSVVCLTSKNSSQFSIKEALLSAHFLISESHQISHSSLTLVLGGGGRKHLNASAMETSLVGTPVKIVTLAESLLPYLSDILSRIIQALHHYTLIVAVVSHEKVQKITFLMTDLGFCLIAVMPCGINGSGPAVIYWRNSCQSGNPPPRSRSGRVPFHPIWNSLAYLSPQFPSEVSKYSNLELKDTCPEQKIKQKAGIEAVLKNSGQDMKNDQATHRILFGCSSWMDVIFNPSFRLGKGSYEFEQPTICVVLSGDSKLAVGGSCQLILILYFLKIIYLVVLGLNIGIVTGTLFSLKRYCAWGEDIIRFPTSFFFFFLLRLLANAKKKKKATMRFCFMRRYFIFTSEQIKFPIDF